MKYTTPVHQRGLSAICKQSRTCILTIAKKNIGKGIFLVYYSTDTIAHDPRELVRRCSPSHVKDDGVGSYEARSSHKAD